MTQEDDSTYLPEKPESQTVLYRALDQLKHLAGTDRNSFFEPTPGTKPCICNRILKLWDSNQLCQLHRRKPLHREKQSEPVTAGWAKPLAQTVVYIPMDISLMLT